MKLVLLYSSCIIWFSPVVVHTEEHDALIFDRFEASLYLLPKKIPEDLECEAWAIACPAETPAEQDFIKKVSFTGNALFVKEICHRGDKASKLKKKTCKQPHKISISYKARNDTFQFGFEIYYEIQDEQYYHRDTVSGDYKGIEEVTNTKVLSSKVKKGILAFKEAYRIAKKAVGVDIREVWLNRDRRMGFLWLYLFKISFDFSKKILKMIWYEIEGNNQWTIGEQCEFYSLGREVYHDTGTNIDGLYVKQSEIFKNMDIPEGCGENGEHLARWSLIPVDQFRFGYKTKPLCSNMATIPIWTNKLENIMRKVDTYLFTLYQVLKESLHITAGISGELEMPKKGRMSRGKIPVYLDPANKKVPVPKIIYKIVEYQVKDCKAENCWCSAVIIIHNDPHFKETNKICRDVTTVWGWEEITKDFSTEKYSKLIYVCENNESLQKKLSIGSREKVVGHLKLAQFPYYDASTLKVEYGPNMKEPVNNLFNNYRNNGVFPDENDRVIRRDHTQGNTIDPEAMSETEGKAGTE